MSGTDLFTEFNRQAKTDWLAKATRDLKDKPLATLNSEWYGIPVAPYYAIEDLTNLDLPSPVVTQPAKIINYVTIEAADATTANQQALQAMNLGATGIVFNLAGKTDFDSLLKNIELPHCAVGFSGETATTDYLTWLTQTKQSAYRGFIESPQPCRQPTAADFYPTVIASPDENEVDELTGILNQVYHLLLPVAEADAEVCISNIAYKVHMSPNYFFGIAKIRALRLLLSRFYAAYKLAKSTDSFHIIAASPPWQNQAYEPHENMLKATTAAMAAIVGGANAVGIAPGYDDEQEKLVARNISTLLEFESYLTKVADPAAGSYFLENLTRDIVNKVWDNFKNNLPS